MLELPKALEEKYEKASEILSSHDKFRILSHYDADGISAASVLALTLMRDQKGFHARFLNKLSNELPKGLPLILSDIGNSHLEELKELDDPVIVLDHHDVEKTVESDKEEHVFINPHEFGIDGAQDVSGGTLSLILAVLHDNKNWSLSIYGLAGAAADKQNINGFTGLNKQLLDISLEKKKLTRKQGLYIDGEGIKDSLMKACDPYFPGISGRENKINSILEDLEIDPETPVDEIPNEASRELDTLLTLSLIERDIPNYVIESIKGPLYISKRIDLELNVLYKLLNSAARTNSPGTGMSFCLGDMSSLGEIKETRAEYRIKMVERLHDLEKNGPNTMENIQYFFEEKKERKGELAGLGMLYLFDQSKPAFGITKVNGNVDISGRANKKLVKRGLNLGRLCREIAEELGGSGGGHDIAAGATVPESKLDEFLDKMDKAVKDILNN